MVTRSQVLAVSSARLRWPTTHKTSPSLSSWYKLWLVYNLVWTMDGMIGGRKLPKVEKQGLKSLGPSL